MSCPACGGANEPGDRFCGSCGSALGESAAPAASAPAPGAERRLVSVLFADLVGFTTLSEHRDPEEVRELLSRYFDRSRVLIERYGGVVEKFIGDAVMAVWGTPVAREDDAERAVRAALALTQAVTALGDEVGMPGLRVRAGVLTGPAAVDLAADGEGMVLGDTVNTASRLQSIAAPGTVLVDDVTRRSSEASIVYEEAGTHQVKGREAPVRAWTALRVVAGVGGARRSSGLEAPFVGRDAALARIVTAAEETVAEGTARRVLVVGDAGSGKSRLLWELFKHIDGVEARFWWHQGRALSYGEGVGYWALAEMVRTRAGILEEEDPATARAKLAAVTERYVTDERERRLVEPRLAHLLGLEQRMASDRADLFSGWRLFFERLAATGPVILAFEDLHWADSSLLDFIDYLLEWSAGSPIFVLGLGRHELTANRPTWMPDVVLDALPDGAMHELLEGLVPGLPAELAERIRARAEGVPLYAVETVRMLLDRGLLVQQGARYVVTGDVSHLEVPETLHALVAARLDGLDPGERSALQLASVFGHAFPAAAVAALSGRPVDEVDRRLDGLVAKQVLGYEDDPRTPERGQYRFLQGLLRTIAYGTLSRRDRKAHHLAAARYVQESAEAGEVADVLASHFLEAARADPDAADAPRIRAAARETLIDAAERARSLALGREAQRAFDQAAELAEDDAQRAELLEQAGRAALLEATGDAVEQRIGAAIALYEAAGAAEAAARASLVLAEVQWLRDDPEGALAIAERARERLAGSSVDRALAAAFVGRLHSLRLEHELALQGTGEALEIAEPLQCWGIIADALITRGSTLGILGRAEEARALMSRGIALAETHGDSSAMLRGYNNLGWLDSLHDDLDAAGTSMERAEAVARGRGDRIWMRRAANSRGAVRAEQGDWDGVEALVAGLDLETIDIAGGGDLLPAFAITQAARGRTAGLARAAELGSAYSEAAELEVREVGVIGLAAVAASRGDHAEAMERLAPVMRSPATTYGRLAIVIYLESALAAGRADRIAETVDWIRALPPVRATPTIRAQAARFAALAAEDDAEAERLFTEAATLLRERRRPFELAKVLLDHAERLGDRARLDEARQLFVTLDAQPWVERCERALAGAAS